MLRDLPNKTAQLARASPLQGEGQNLLRRVWVGAQVDPLMVFVGVVSELSWG